MRKILNVFLVLCLTLSLVACGGTNTINTTTVNLSENFNSEIKEYDYFDSNFISAQNSLSFKLFDKINEEKKNENIVFSPISITSVLGMLSNGADDKTLNEFENLFGISNDELNHSLYTFFNSLGNTGKVVNTNSLWLKNDDRFLVNDSFLQTNADFYKADVFKSPFDNSTIKEINKWVTDKTDGEIDKIIDDISPNACMFLINALTFDAEWYNPYTKSAITDGSFKTLDSSVPVKMMHSREHFYIETNNAVGVIKDYKNSDYRFVALLPDESVDINDYISSLKSSNFDAIIKSAHEEDVITAIPKFESKFEITLNDTLKSLGLNRAFDMNKADFSNLGTYQGGNLYLQKTLQKAYIKVDERGTKAGAVTMAAIANKSSLPSRIYSVILDRPFVYAIIDAKTNIPLFIGKVVNP